MDSAERGTGREESRHTSLTTDCEGFIAVTALIIMAILLMIGVAFLSMATTENTMVFNEIDGQAAFNIAEAGIEHARAVLKTCNLTNVLGNNGLLSSSYCSNISNSLNNNSASLAVGGTSGTYTVVVTNNMTAINGIPADTGGATTDTDNRVVATSTGTYRRCATCPTATRTIQAMIERTIPKPKSTLEANTNVNVQSASAIIDGRNNDCNGNNPSPDGNLPAATTPTGTAGISINKSGNLLCDAGSGTTNCGGTSGTFPDTIGALLLRDSTPPATQSQIDALNAYLESIKISSAQAATQWPKTGAPFHGIVYVDGDYANPPDGSTGILIVHHRDASNHDVATLGNFNGGTFKGLIIADKINKINGNAQIIGAIFGFGNGSDGVAVDDVTGTPGIKYSKCAIDTYVSQDLPSWIVPGTWHEQ